jgi:hypothetical protein
LRPAARSGARSCRVGRLSEGDRVPVRIRNLDVADTVRVGLDRLALDAVDRDALQEYVEPPDGQGDAARAHLRGVWLDEEPSAPFTSQDRRDASNSSVAIAASALAAKFPFAADRAVSIGRPLEASSGGARAAAPSCRRSTLLPASGTTGRIPRAATQLGSSAPRWRLLRAESAASRGRKAGLGGLLVCDGGPSRIAAGRRACRVVALTCGRSPLGDDFAARLLDPAGSLVLCRRPR